MPRMRTIAESIKLLKEDDPETAITQNALRSMVLTGRIPHVSVGIKRLINYDMLVEYLQNSPVPTEAPGIQGTIRRVI